MDDDDDLDNIDFLALDKLVEDHQAKAQVPLTPRLLPYRTCNPFTQPVNKHCFLAHCR